MFGLLWLRVDTPVDGILVFTEGVLRELKGEEKRRRQFGLAEKCHESSNIYFSRYVYRPRVRLRRD